MFPKAYLKTKKMTDISQTQAGFKAKSLGILCGFQGFLTQNPAALVETDDIFDVSDTPYRFSGLNHAAGLAGVPNPSSRLLRSGSLPVFAAKSAAAKPEQKAHIFCHLLSHPVFYARCFVISIFYQKNFKKRVDKCLPVRYNN